MTEPILTINFYGDREALFEEGLWSVRSAIFDHFHVTNAESRAGVFDVTVSTRPGDEPMILKEEAEE